MANSNFQDLEVWNEGKELAVQIFNIWQKIDNKGCFSLQDQMQRSALSIPSNIAEGSERKSATEFMRYLYIAKGSTAELRTQLYIFNELKGASKNLLTLSLRAPKGRGNLPQTLDLWGLLRRPRLLAMTHQWVFRGALKLSDGFDVNAIVDKTLTLSRKISRLISAISNSRPS